MRTVRIWYYNGCQNFGDQLNPHILNILGRKFGVRFVYTPHKNNAQLIGIGSILHSMPSSFRGQVWTSGSLGYPHKPLRASKIWGVRGHITAKNYHAKAIGDGALLLPLIYTKPVTKKYKVGIVPHYVDRKLVRSLVRPNPNILILNVQDPPAKFIQKMRQCSCIFSSSLHGLIAADAFNIPNRQFRVSSSTKIRGGMYKYRDYYSLFGLPLPKHINLTARTPLLTKWYHITVKYYQRPGLLEIRRRLAAITDKMLRGFATP